MTTTDPLVARMRPFGTTIFAEMSALAVRTGAVNLGQGFPDTDGPPEMLAAAAEALRSGHNQYPPGPGIPALRTAVAAHQRRQQLLHPQLQPAILGFGTALERQDGGHRMRRGVRRDRR